MTTSRNDITGDLIKSKTNTEKYSSGWDTIFGKKTKKCAECNNDADQEFEANDKTVVICKPCIDYLKGDGY